MTGFSMANMDYTPVKFMIKVFEANYPESLGHICVHKAPWIFNTIWGIIKGWLDPVVASKIRFTKDDKDLEEVMPRANIPHDLGGDEDWSYEYVEPRAGEVEALRSGKDAQRKEIETERAGLVDEFEKLTLQWVRGEVPAATLQPRRSEVAKRLAENYWRLDPFVRAPSLYDRLGVLGPGGRVNMYPERSAASGTGTTTTTTLPVRSATTGVNGAAPAPTPAPAAAPASAPAAEKSGSTLRPPPMVTGGMHGGDESDDERGAASFETAREF